MIHYETSVSCSTVANVLQPSDIVRLIDRSTMGSDSADQPHDSCNPAADQKRLIMQV